MNHTTKQQDDTTPKILIEDRYLVRHLLAWVEKAVECGRTDAAAALAELAADIRREAAVE